MKRDLRIVVGEKPKKGGVVQVLRRCLWAYGQKECRKKGDGGLGTFSRTFRERARYLCALFRKLETRPAKEEEYSPKLLSTGGKVG